MIGSKSWRWRASCESKYEGAIYHLMSWGDRREEILCQPILSRAPQLTIDSESFRELTNTTQQDVRTKKIED